MNEFNQEQSTITNQKIEEIRRECNALLDRSINVFSAAIIETDVEREKFESNYRYAVEKIKTSGGFVTGMKYITSLLLKTVGISFLDIDPVFVNFNSYEQFKEKINADKLKAAEEIYKTTYEVAEKGYSLLKSIKNDLEKAKATINSSRKSTMLFFKGLIKSCEKNNEKKFDDLTIYYDALVSCGITPSYTMEHLKKENLYTTKFNVREFVLGHLKKYQFDKEIEREINNISMKM